MVSRPYKFDIMVAPQAWALAGQQKCPDGFSMQPNALAGLPGCVKNKPGPTPNIPGASQVGGPNLFGVLNSDGKNPAGILEPVIGVTKDIAWNGGKDTFQGFKDATDSTWKWLTDIFAGNPTILIGAVAIVGLIVVMKLR